MRSLNYQHLFYFWNIARSGSITKAAARLRLAQPTISAQIKTFEDTIGEKLFEKNGRSLKLTESGRLAFKYADEIFTLGQELLDSIDGKPEGFKVEFKIGISNVILKTLAYSLIEPSFSCEAEGTVVCFEGTTDHLLTDLAAGELDLVIADRPIANNHNVKAYNHFLGQSNVSFLAVKELAKMYQVNFPYSLSGAPLLLPIIGSALRNDLDIWFEKLEVFPNIVGVFQDRALMKLAAKNRKGIVPVPSVVAEELMKYFNLQLVGETSDLKERIYIVSLERRLKNKIICKIFNNAKDKLFHD